MIASSIVNVDYGLTCLEAAGDSEVGSVVEARWTEPSNGRQARLVLAVRCDLGA